MSNKLTIAISGKSGCGNTSVSGIVADRLNLRLINFTFHNLADELGIPFNELLQRAHQDPQYDLSLDRRQKELASAGNCVLGSRLAIWLLPCAELKVYLTASPECRAKRIAQREKRPWEEVMRETVVRDRNDHERFLKLYGIDNDRYDFVDLIINTEEGNQFYVAEKIIEFVRKRFKG